MTGKTAVVLFNLGGPDKPESIRPFLLNFFMDPNIIQAPYPVRFAVSRLIANRRSKNEAGTAYGKLGGKSPLLDNTNLQAGALQGALGPDYRVFVCMRYWHPLAGTVASLVKDYNPDQIILLPLYPQFSTTTTHSSFQDWNKAAAKIGLKAPTRYLCCYPLASGFIAASAARIRPVYQELLARHPKTPPRILFSAHGLPEKIIRGGDPYQWQCEISARQIAEELGIYNLDWQVCYQSRVGPLKWIGPSTEEALHKAAKDQVPVLIYPHAFVSEHVETLVEIEDEYRHLASKLGIPDFARVETVGTHPEFIKGLAETVRLVGSPRALASSETAATPINERACPSEFRRCCQNNPAKSGFRSAK